MQNPLLSQEPLPLFNQIKPQHVVPAIEQILSENRQAIKNLLAKTKHFSWDNLVVPLDELHDKLNHAWSPISHLNSVLNSDALREAYNECLPKISDYSTELGQNTQLYEAFVSLAASPEFKQLQAVQQKVINDALRDFRLSGIGLSKQAKKQFQQLKQRLSQLTSQFADNVLDATNAWSHLVTNRQDLAGLPEHAILAAAETAKQRRQEGWLFTLEYPSYLPVLTFAENRQLREIMYTAFVTRASDQGPFAGQWDNTAIMDEILKLRYELAQLLGFKNYTEYSLATKMAKSSEQVMHFLEDLGERSLAMAKREFAELTAFAKQSGLSELQPWDIAFYSEKLQQHTYAISQEDLRPYFPIDKVLKGMFAVIQRLYNMRVTELSSVNTWHEHTRFFGISDAQGRLRGQFYLDLYARPSKRGGAWMDECRVRRYLANGELQTPVAYLTCNFTAPVADQPALLTHDEVLTLFHEFGHGLHHLLTQVDYAAVSGINGVAWDAVELPSQFMENWCWEKEALAFIAGHYQTDAPLADELLEKMQRAKNFQAGMQMLRQVEFSIFDWRIHSEYDPIQGIDVQAVLNEVRQHYCLTPVIAINRFQHSFSHIFAGGYAAGYYSYKWAEVLASDAFARFKEEGIFNSETGQSFLENILQKGGSEDAMDLFKAFRGREPRIDALLEANGIADLA